MKAGSQSRSAGFRSNEVQSLLTPHFYGGVMSEELTDAIGAVLGLCLGGAMLLYLGANTSPTFGVDVSAWGMIFIFGALALSIVIVYAVLQSVLGGGW